LRRQLVVETLEARCLLSYTITDLGTLGGSLSEGYAINGSGQVAGFSQAADSTLNGFLGQDGQAMIDLAPYPGGGSNSKAFALNDAGVAVGWSDNDPDANHQQATIWSGTVGQALGTLGGLDSEALGVNNFGQVVGDATLPDGTDHAFFFDGTTMNDLGTLGGSYSVGYDINDMGQVVGAALLPDGITEHAFLYPDDQGNLIDLGSLGGQNSVARAINQLGDVVGSSITADLNAVHAFLLPSGSSNMIDLGSLGGSSEALGVNNLDQVVGDSGNQAFLYDGGSMIALNNLLPPDADWNLLAATGINDSGQITGYGKNADGSIHAFLMTPDVGPTMPHQIGHVSLGGTDSLAGGLLAAPVTEMPSVPGPRQLEQPATDAPIRQTAPAETAALLPARGDVVSTNLLADPLAAGNLGALTQRAATE
jgi:probable HAF family extracellular repeat protein